MSNFRRVIFWIHLTLGILTGLVGALMAGTAVIMSFADTYLDIREYRARHVDPPEGVKARSLANLNDLVKAAYPNSLVTRIGLDRDPHHAFEFYHGKQELLYVDPYSGKLHPSDVVPLRRYLHKGVEQWHRFIGLSGEHKKTAKSIISWSNVALIPLLLSGLLLWWPGSLRWRAVRTGITPVGSGRGRGTKRSWHTALGFWALPFLLIMVVTATTHSFALIRNNAYRLSGSTPPGADSSDSLWARGLPTQSIATDAIPLSSDELRSIADRELPDWTRLDIFPASPPKPGNKTGSARLVAKAPGWGPGFFPVVLQVNPFTGKTLDLHSWSDLSSGTRLLAWSRWLHKGEAFGRPGQIVAGLACLMMLVLIYTGWALAIRRILRRRHTVKNPH